MLFAKTWFKIKRAYCCLFGHKAVWGIEPKSFWSPSANAMVDCGQYHCGRCGEKDVYAVPRNLYHRTLAIWISAYKNRRHFKKFFVEQERIAMKRDLAHLRYLRYCYDMDQAMRRNFPQKDQPSV